MQHASNRNDPGHRLYYGDNLDVLREHVEDASVELIYLDPPFNSNAGYNVLFRTPTGSGADASIEAFDDTWTWGEAAKHALLDIAAGTNRPLAVMMDAMHRAIGENPLMAYLSMMAVRLVELHRVLKPTGSLYLHCDPTASHYLKLLLDAVFGKNSVANEIVWKRTYSHRPTHRFSPIHDIIFLVRKSDTCTWNSPTSAHDEAYLTRFRNHDAMRNELYQDISLTGPGRTGGESGAVWRGHDPGAKGRHWAIPRAVLQREGIDASGTLDLLDELDRAGRIHFSRKADGLPRLKWFVSDLDGVSVPDVWWDIAPVNSQAQERLGYPTQKPRALLERIIAASSNPGDTVLDPFCGCGTAVDAAQKLDRRWIGIDVTHLAIGMIEDRMRQGYPGIAFETIGVPRDLASAERLARDDPHQFQQWVCWQLGGYPRDKKGGDRGVDGWFNYLADGSRIETGVVSVKAGDVVNPTMVRDLGRVMEREHHRFGLFVMKAMPTKGMREEAASHPTIETGYGRFPALQIVTLAELMAGRRPALPPLVSPTKRAARVEMRRSHQPGAQGALL